MRRSSIDFDIHHSKVFSSDKNAFFIHMRKTKARKLEKHKVISNVS